MGYLDLQICMDGWQWTLHPQHLIKVWRHGRRELVAELPLTLVSNILAHYLTQAHLTAEVLGAPRMPLAPAPPQPGPLPLGVPEKSLRETRRARRKARRRESRDTRHVT